jgi:hypothetical protein
MGIDARSRSFWPIEVSALCGAAAQSITNWRHHEYLDGIGEFDAAASRWNYSIIDAIKLRIINDLATVGYRLPFAAAIAANIDVRVEERAAGKKRENQVIVAWSLATNSPCGARVVMSGLQIFISARVRQLLYRLITSPLKS